MTAAVLAVAWAAGACVIAPLVGRALRKADPAEDHLSPEWIAGIPTDCLGDGPLLRERFDAIVTREWVL